MEYLLRARVVVGRDVGQLRARRESHQCAREFGQRAIETLRRLIRVRREEPQLRPRRVDAVQQPEQLHIGDAVFGDLLDAFAAPRAERETPGKQDVGHAVDAFDVQRMRAEREARRHVAGVELELAARGSLQACDGADRVVGMRLEVEEQAHRVTFRRDLGFVRTVQIHYLDELAIRAARPRERRLVHAAVAAVGVR
jgi:hypothetical protein